MSAELAIPTTRAARHALIREILAEQAIGSQERLRTVLAETGVDVTQATLSRDLMDMRATKVRNAEGQQLYTVPDLDGSATHQTEASITKVTRWAQELLVAVDRVGHQLILRTPVGAANLLASSLDAARLDDIAGTIAGDDTIVVICRGEQEALRTQDLLLNMASSD